MEVTHAQVDTIFGGAVSERCFDPPDDSDCNRKHDVGEMERERGSEKTIRNGSPGGIGSVIPHFNILKALYAYSFEDSNACGDGQVF